MFIIVSELSKARLKMIVNPDWLKPKEKPYFHQISMDCLEKLTECMESIDTDEMDAGTLFRKETNRLY